MKQYDLAFSLGRACSCTETLRKAGLQYLSFPWDWIAIDAATVPDIKFRADTLCEGSFHSWFTPEDLKFVAEYPWHSKTLYQSRKTGISYNHDFPKGISLSESFPAVKSKYERRLARLMKLISESKNILLVCIDPPNPKHPTPIEDCHYARNRLSERFPHAHFDFVLISYRKGVTFEERLTETPTDGFLHVTFDYKDYTPGKPSYAIVLDRTAAILRERFSVRDYRTKKEIKALRAKTRKVKMQAAGAENAWQYFLARRRNDFLKLANRLSPRILMARHRAKRYNHVLSLGVNCDAGFRFCQKWGFVDSTPFSWSQTFDIEHLVQALRNPGKIGSEGFSWHEPSLMWRCNCTGICFHGRMEAALNQPKPDDESLKADLSELVSRLNHLWSKLFSLIADDSSKAFIYRINTKEVLTGNANEKLDELQHTLENLGAKNYVLVIITEKKVKRLLQSSSNRTIRCVKRFNPQNLVTKANLGDPVGWNAIFTEFAPASIKKATHKFKFEK